ncbi:protein kinase domain-containing protein [Nocardia sp. CA-128927]|uniref:serine/threonine-protein kinase n=1 Tax=Nocardia sp. CA-128927 TaxID=3239975 RepID=UPI003D98A66C
MGQSSITGTRVGTQFGHYQLNALLGQGGMGEVYEAYDTAKDRTVAVKILRESLANDPVYKERFRRESHAAARLREPHVIPIHDWGEIDGELYIDMRLVQGHNLRSLVTGYGPIAPARAVALIEQVAAALDAAHADTLIHRDVKPENILVTRDDFAYLVDFGIAHCGADPGLTALGSAIGSYGYMAPERFDDVPATNRADVYSLACVLDEIMTGERPFRATSVSQVIKAHLTSPPPRPSSIRPGIPAGFDTVIARGMAKDPKDRYRTAGDLARAARAALSSPQRVAPTAIVDHAVSPTTVVQLGKAPSYEATAVRPATGHGSVADIASRTNPSAAPDGISYGSLQYPSGLFPSQARRSRIGSVAVTLLVVVLLGLGGVVAWLVVSQSKSSEVASTSGVPSVGSVQLTAVVPAVPAAMASLPPTATPCASVFGRTGPFTASAAGTSVTSCPFAEEVRRAYAASGPPAPQPGPVVAVSPVTGLTYTMICTANTGLVSCTGGNDAVVYVY